MRQETKRQLYLSLISLLLCAAFAFFADLKIAGNTTGQLIEVDTTSKAGRTSSYDTSGNVGNIDTDKNLVVSLKLLPHVSVPTGEFALAAPSGQMAASLGAGSTIFSARWGDDKKLAIIKYISLSAISVVAAGAAANVDFELIKVRGFTLSDSGGTSIKPALTNNKTQTSDRDSFFTDLRVASTTNLTVGTRIVDGSDIFAPGYANISANTIPRSLFCADSATGCANLVILYDSRKSRFMQYPLVLAQDEGIIIRNITAFPVTFQWRFTVNMQWIEVGNY